MTYLRTILYSYICAGPLGARRAEELPAHRLLFLQVDRRRQYEDGSEAAYLRFLIAQTFRDADGNETPLNDDLHIDRDILLSTPLSYGLDWMPMCEGIL